MWLLLNRTNWSSEGTKMKVLVFVHDLGIGGSQLNAIELASELRLKGHDVIIFGRPGPLVEKVRHLDLEFLPAPAYGRRPSGAVVRELVALARSRHLDVLHGYEWPPTLECYLAARQLPDTVAVSTVMSMRVAPFIPKHLPLSVGTELIAHAERDLGRTDVSLMEPPVDTMENQPGLNLGQHHFRSNWGLSDDTYTVAMVSRLAHQLKLEGILSAMESVAQLSSTLKVSLVIAGDGPARQEVQQRAADLNRHTGRKTIVLTGELADPRPLYDVADICLGMGGSALRAMAFSKPLVVQGEGGFWELLTPSTLSTFLWQGWYGAGNDPTAGTGKLSGLLRELLPAERLRQDLGAFGQRVVRERFSLHKAGDRQLAIYTDALAIQHGPRSRIVHDVVAAGRFVNFESRRVGARLAGRETSDDFNSRPLTAPGNLQASTSGASGD
jgi:glycosyltransferase involved in cell wall biosynthesis